MGKYFLFFIFLLFIFAAQGQTLTIVEQETGKPLEMVTVRSVEVDEFKTTDELGQVNIADFKGAEQIEIRSLGYETFIKSYADLKNMGFELVMIPAITRFDDVVASASKWEQSSADIPTRISKVSPKDIALQNPQTAADLLATSGEVFIQKSQQGGGSPMIRGFSTNRLLYSVDGVRMNSAIFRSGNLQNVISLDPFTMENTEVFFGPGAIIYGSDAIGGVMSFQTLKPQLATSDELLVSGNAVSRYSSANSEGTYHFDLNLGWEKWALVTSFTHANFGDLTMGRNGPDDYLRKYYVKRIDHEDRVVENPNPLVQNPTGYSQINLMQKVRFKPNNRWDFEYGFHYSETSDFPRYDRLIEMEGDLPRSAVWNYGPQVWMMNNLSATHTASNFWFDRVIFRLAQQTFEESRIDRRFNHHRLRTQAEEVQAYSANIDFERIVDKHRFHYGVEYILNQVHSDAEAEDIRNGQPIAVPNRYPNADWQSYAIYLNHQYRFSDQFLVQSGLRFNGFDINADFSQHLAFFPFDFTATTTRNNATNASLGLIYKPNKKWKISTNWSTGFRAPNVDDIGKVFDFVAGQVVVPNTNLSAEYAYNAELSIDRRIGEFVQLDITGFYTYLDNAMVRRTFQVDGQDSIVFDGEMSEVYAIQNAAYSEVYGFNAGFEVKLPSGFSVASRYNYQIGEEEMESGEISRSRHAPPAYGTSSITYQNDKLMMQFYAMYSTEVAFEDLNEEERQKPFIYAKDSNGNPYSPAWYTLNIKATYQIDKHFTVMAGVENLTDQRYRPYASGLTAPGRNFIMSLRAHF